MQHRLKRGRGFIIRNANREAAALRGPPVFEGGATLTTPPPRQRRRPCSLSRAAARISRASEQPPPTHYCAAAQPPPRRACRAGRTPPRHPASPARSPTPWSQTPNICLTLQPYGLQILTFRPFPIKPHEFFIGKGRFCLYLGLYTLKCVSKTYTPAPAYTSTSALGRNARLIYGAIAAITWFGFGATVIITACDGYARGNVDPGMFGTSAPGWSGAPTRLFETFSYFTEWSNILVAVVATYLARHQGPASNWWRALQLCATMMITVTGIVYAGFIGPYKQLSGWDYLTNPIQHIIVPLAMVLAWFITGPRGGIDRGVILRSLVIPVVWVPFILIRGAITHTYPYGFLNVEVLGYALSLMAIGFTLVFALVCILIFAGFDRWLTRRAQH